jgi:hypothetical protein
VSEWTKEDQAVVGRVLLGRWPSQVAQWGREGLAAFMGEIAGSGVDPVTAVKAARASTSAFAPSAGELTALAQRVVQGPAPTFTEAQRVIRERVATTLDYRNPSIGFDRLVEWCGEHHETVARLAVALGPQGCRSLPDPRDAHGAATRASEQGWREVCAAWQEDPRPGVALVEARRVAGVIDGDHLIPVGGVSAIEAARSELAEGHRG